MRRTACQNGTNDVEPALSVHFLYGCLEADNLIDQQDIADGELDDLESAGTNQNITEKGLDKKIPSSDSSRLSDPSHMLCLPKFATARLLHSSAPGQRTLFVPLPLPSPLSHTSLK